MDSGRPDFSTINFNNPREVPIPFVQRTNGGDNTTLADTKCTFTGFDGATVDDCEFQECSPSADAEGGVQCQPLACTAEYIFKQ